MLLAERVFRVIGFLLIIGGVGLSMSHQVAPTEGHLLLYFGLLLAALGAVVQARRLRRRVQELEDQLSAPPHHP